MRPWGIGDGGTFQGSEGFCMHIYLLIDGINGWRHSDIAGALAGKYS